MQQQKQKDTLSDNTQTTSHPDTCAANTADQSPTSSLTATSNTNTNTINRIIESTQQIINSQAMKIFQLNNQVKMLRKQNIQIRNKYQILLKMCESGQHNQEHNNKQSQDKQQKINENCVNVEEFVKKINALEDQLVGTKMELAQCKAEFLELKYMSMKSQKNIKIQSPESIKFPEFQRVKSTIQNLSQIQKTDETLLVGEWSKIFQNFNTGYPRIFKLKQKSIQLSKKGIPQSLRQSIWPLIFQNKIGITNALYSQLLHRRNQDQNYTKRVLSQINKDICRSFNGKTKFQSKTGLNAQVTQILEIFHMYRPDVSYVQGMTYPVIVLNLIVGKYKAFTIFSNLILGNDFFLKLYTFQQNYLTCYCRTFDMLLQQKLPKLTKLFNDRSIHSQIYLVQWFYTFFSRGLSYQFTLKIWDLLAYQGQVLFYKLGISIFQLIQNTLIHTQGQQPLTIIREFSNYLTEIKLWDKLNSQKLTPEKLQKTFDKIFKKQMIKSAQQSNNK